MQATAQRITYKSTGYFSKIVTDYLDQAEELKPFYMDHPSLDGIKNAIAARKNFPTNRQLLVKHLQRQYAGTAITEKQLANIAALNNENCFTITTAHQPNIFTGHLYFIYKILHAVKLAAYLQEQLPGNNFVPVYYMGSEDADLEELGEVYINGSDYHWKTKQTGAVGRMKVDDELIKIIEAIAGQILVETSGEEIIALIKECYTKGTLIEQATFKLVNALFGEYGLLTLLPDDATLKSSMIEIFKDDIINNTSAQIVENTSEKLGEHYKVQAHPRAINLFYLKDDRRERLEKKNDQYFTVDTQQSFSETELITELNDHPERFSPNVILRGLYQETILPNIAFIGGGGELAYWLQLKDLFEHYKVPYPVQVLRNSFMLVNERLMSKAEKLGLKIDELFAGENLLLNKIVKLTTSVQLNLDNEKKQLALYYSDLKKVSGAVDVTLEKHVENLYAKALKKIEDLEKKMLHAEKLKHEAQQRQLHKLKTLLFPKNGLQERVENFISYYANWNKDFIKNVYEHSLALEQEFCILKTD